MVANLFPHQKFRPNVAALVRVNDMYVACERADIPNAWQCVQGGVEASDVSWEAAILRELTEELGAAAHNFTIIARSKHWRRYKFIKSKNNGNYCGQEQLWFEVELNNVNAIDLSVSVGEFCSIKLVTMADFIKLYMSWKHHVFQDFCFERNLLEQQTLVINNVII